MGNTGASLCLVAVVLLTAGCSCPPDPCDVTEIELVPSRVAIAPDPMKATTFVLEARLWSGPANDRETIVPSTCGPLTWSVSPPGLGLTFKSKTGYLATLVLEKGVTPPASMEVKVEKNGREARTQVISSATTGDDPVTADYTDDRRPDAVVVRGIRTSADMPCALWVAPGLVRTGVAGQVQDGCGGGGPPWGVALLDQGSGMSMYHVPWTPGVNPSSPGSMPLLRMVPVATRVFISGADLSTRQTNATKFAQDEIADANSVFYDNRVGIRLMVADAFTVPQPPGPHIETNVPNCATGDKLTSPYDYKSGSEPMLHIYLVDGTSSADGFTCPPSDGRPFPVIYLAVGRSGTILLHEVGHALGLDVPGAGHSDQVEGFDPADVMAGGYADTDNIWRRRLTVGQVFRMNADAGSWLNWGMKLGGMAPIREIGAPRLACQCGYDDPAGSCPRLVDDVARKRGGLRHLETWDCGDQIWMDKFDATDNPLALIAGREWRSAVSECPRYFAGYPLSHDSRVWMSLRNLTRTTKCKPWVAIFFEKYRPVFRTDEAMDGEWTDAADVRYARDVLQAPRTVIVHVWFDLADAYLMPLAESASENIFGKPNRGGLTFVWHEHSPLPSTCPADLPNSPVEYQVCYTSKSGPTLPQLLGEKWGLHLLAGGELSNPVFANNAMQPTAAADGLTLGQVFRVHATLLPSTDFTDCVSTTCPPLETDAGP